MNDKAINKLERYRQFFLHVPELCLVVSPKGIILDVNKCVLKKLGYTKNGLLDKSIKIIYSAKSLPVIKKLIVDRTRTLENMEEEVMLLTRNKEEHAAILSARRIKGEDGETLYFILSHRDVTERKKLEERLKASIREKEVLLKEIHHRVKNNMQIIYSLINYQSRYIKDKDLLNMFNDTQARIRSMALIHEKFYQTKDVSQINFADYVKNLIAALFHSHGVRNGDVVIELKIESVFVGINTGIPCGLIINELVSNSLKHAFSDGRKGKIIIDFHPYKENKYILNFSDNGIGIPEDIDFRRTESLGLQLINTLVEQLEGKIELDRRNGTAFRIVFEKLMHERSN